MYASVLPVCVCVVGGGGRGGYVRMYILCVYRSRDGRLIPVPPRQPAMMKCVFLMLSTLAVKHVRICPAVCVCVYVCVCVCVCVCVWEVGGGGGYVRMFIIRVHLRRQTRGVEIEEERKGKYGWRGVNRDTETGRNKETETKRDKQRNRETE